MPVATQLRRYGFALAAMILVTEIGFLQRIFSMVDLTLGSGGSASASPSALVVVEEIIKVVPPPAEAAGTPRPSPSPRARRPERGNDIR